MNVVIPVSILIVNRQIGGTTGGQKNLTEIREYLNCEYKLISWVHQWEGGDLMAFVSVHLSPYHSKIIASLS